MAKNDLQIVKGGGEVIQQLVEDRTTSSDTQLFAGEPVKKAGTGTNFVQHVATGEPTNAAPMYGITVDDSTETSTADGNVNTQLLIPGRTILRGKATTAANIDTQAKLDALINDAVTLDLTSTTFTIDENEGDDPDVHGLIIVGGNIDKGTLDVLVKDFATEQGGTI